VDVPRSDLEKAERLQERAVIENGLGRPARASAAIAKGLRLLGADGTADPDIIESPAEAEVDRSLVIAKLLVTLAKSEVEMFGVDRALATLALASRWAAVPGGDGLRAALHNQWGLVLYRGGRLAAAVAEFNEAERWFAAAPAIEKCRVLANRGALHIESGNLAAARQDLINCIDEAGALSVTVMKRVAIHNLGYLEFISGDLPLALRTMDDGMALDGETQVGIALLDRARVLLAAGLRREADESLAAAAKQLSKDRAWQDVGEVELARAESSLLAGELSAARRLAGRARDRFRRHGNDRWRRNAELVLLQADLAAGRPAARLLPPTRRLVTEFYADGFPVQARTAQLLTAELLLRMGNLDSAAAAATEAGSSRRTDPIPIRLHTRLVRTQLELAVKKSSAARRHLRAGMTELADYQAQFGSLDMQTASAVHGRRLVELDIETAMSDGRPHAVLEAVERGRAMSSRLMPVQPPEDEVAAGLLAELRRAVDGLKGIESEPASAKRLDAERRRIVDLQRQLRARSWQVGRSGAAARTATTREVQAALQSRSSTLVCYVHIGDALHAVVIAPDRRASIHRLGSASGLAENVRRVRADLDVLANGYLPEALLVAVRTSLHRSLAGLAEQLLAPLALPDDRLVIVPTGVLATVPWTNLRSLQGRPIVVTPSATAWLNASSSADALGAPSVVALAGPDLARADDEVKAIGELWPAATALTSDRASRSDLSTAMTDANVVHVAAHGEHQAENPLFSSIRLADGPLFAYELDQTARAAEHVILSACELGQATIRPGDEALGLTSVLLHLGSRSVISGVARVHDDVAAEVMTRYHALLSSGVDSSEALAEACAQERDLPAPFVCFGSAWRA
jgi:CHAT domain-containing protein/tetratricopeptide (TPR) repeat protein